MQSGRKEAKARGPDYFSAPLGVLSRASEQQTTPTPPETPRFAGLPLQPGALTVPSSSGVIHLHGFKQECVVILTRLGPGAHSSFLSLPSSQS